MKYSIVIPAHNEAPYLPACLRAIAAAAKHHGVLPEVIVVLNRCSDETERVALEHGATVVSDDRRNLAAIRNTGARHASGEILITVDADSVVSENLFAEISSALNSGRYVGGGVAVHPERSSLGIAMTWVVLRTMLFLTGLAGGVYWCKVEDFRSVGGFNEALPFGEDLDFAKRLRAHGRRSGRRFTELRQAHIVTSCRKFDRFGDWHFFKFLLLDGAQIRRGLRGTSTEFQDRCWYDFNSATEHKEKSRDL